MRSSTIETLNIWKVNLTPEEIEEFMLAKTVDDEVMQEIVKKEVTQAHLAAVKGTRGSASLNRIRRLNIVDVSVPMASFLEGKFVQGSTVTLDTLDKWIQHNAELDPGFQKKDAETTPSLTLTVSVPPSYEHNAGAYEPFP
jgi:hypothetical protein